MLLVGDMGEILRAEELDIKEATDAKDEKKQEN
jgi:hypothetical protein